MSSSHNDTTGELVFSGALSPASFILPGTALSSAWVEHTPFAAWLIETLRPRCLVELGTLHGVSYFTFCEAIQRVGCGTRCFAIDTWEGDEHTGFYDNEVWRHVVQLNTRLYSAFSTLLRRTFDQALPAFEDGSIDLLHIDGRHFYDDVKHDFESWIPKLAPSAVVVFHDTNVHERGFGVAQLWRELETRYPSFQFLHGNGLGILAFGPEVPAGLKGLFKAARQPDTEAAVRNAYARLGAAVSDRLSLRHEESMVARMRSDIATLQADGAAAATEAQRLAGVSRDQRVALDASERELNSAQSAVLEAERLKDAVAALERQQHALFSSTSWRLTAPMRWLSRHLRHPVRAARSAVRALRREPPVAALRRSLRDLRSARRISASGLFDPAWYVAAYPDVAAQGGNPLWHFVRSGGVEGRSPCESFDSHWYLQTYPDVKASGANPLLHYLTTGATEGRNPSPAFDTRWYLSDNQDVAASGVNPLSHFHRFGSKENRAPVNPHPDVDEDDGPALPGSAPTLACQPLISIVTPVYNVAGAWLRRAVASVQAQTYAHWELCICDDGSTNPDTLQALAELEQAEPRMRVVRLASNAGISGATNKALDLARGEFVALMDNDDELTPRALQACVAELNRDPTIDVMYSDEDKLDADGLREEPFFKPDWSPLLLREVMYVGHLLVARRSLLLSCGALDPTYDGVQDFELMLRLSEHTRNIHHIRKILYHWRRIPGSVAEHSEAKPGLGLRQIAAVNAHLERTGVQAHAVPHPVLAHRAIVQPLPRDQHPRVSIVIPTKDAGHLISRCLDSIYTQTRYPDFEVVVVDNGTTDPQALAAMARHPVVRVDFSDVFNYSRANNIGVGAATGEILVLLNNDTEIVHGDWLDQLLFLLEQPGVGAVGPLLLYPDRKVQHAGVALGMRGTADHVMRGLAADADGYFGALASTREVSAVTFACTMLRKADYLDAGGLEELYRTHYQDVDLCLRLQAQGKKIVYTPRTTVIHYESATRGTAYDALDRALFLDAWSDVIARGDGYSRWEPEARTGVARA